MHRAYILYNHLYFSELPRDVIREFSSTHLYLPVISHHNFTPRIIEQTILQHRDGETARDLSERMNHTLDHPIELWGTSFREALTETARWILMHLVAFPPQGAQSDELRAAAMRDATPIEYTRALNQLEGSWITIRADESDEWSRVMFHNPSCRDFVLSFLDSEPDYFFDVFDHSTDTAQMSQLIQYADSTSTGSDPKYPSIRALVESRYLKLSEFIVRTWESDSPRAKARSVSILLSFERASGKYGLPLSEWVIEKSLSLSTRLDYSASIDSAAASLLADAVMTARSQPSPGVEVDSCKLLHYAWSGSVSDFTEWNQVFEFRYWIGDSDWDEPHEDELLVGLFDSWLDSEFAVILENADEAEQARSWVEDPRGAANKHFGDGVFEDRFEAFEQSVDAKYGFGYEPSEEDRESMRAGEAIESSGEFYESMKTRLAESAAEIRDIFNQLR